MGDKIEGNEGKQLLVNSQNMNKEDRFDSVLSVSLEYLPGLVVLGAVGTLLSTLTKNGLGTGEEQGCGACEGSSSSQSRCSRKMVSTGADNQLDPLPQLRG